MFRYADGILTLVAALMCGTVVSAQESDFVANMLTDTCRKHNVPSLTIAVVSSDRVVTTRCNGIRKRGTDDAVELWDRHPLGSNTKSMTATLAAFVVESGKIDWDTTIGQVWPDLGEDQLHPLLRDVTLNQLLSHGSGLTGDLNLRGGDWASFFAEKASPPEERRRMLKMILKKKPDHPRGEYHYSNLGYVVAAVMLEKSAGQEFEMMMRRHVFQPLQMDSAAFRTMASARKQTPPLLWGHRSNGEPINPTIAGAENPSVYASCGTVNVTIADYAKYAQWHLRNKPAPLLSTQQAIDHLHTGQIARPEGRGHYGCGWIHLDTGFGRAMTHTGSNTNSFSVIWILPDRDFAAVACTNTGEQAGFLACDEAIQSLMRRYAK